MSGDHADPLIELADVPVADQNATSHSSGGSGSSPSHMDGAANANW